MRCQTFKPLEKNKCKVAAWIHQKTRIIFFKAEKVENIKEVVKNDLNISVITNQINI